MSADLPRPRRKARPRGASLSPERSRALLAARWSPEARERRRLAKLAEAPPLVVTDPASTMTRTVTDRPAPKSAVSMRERTAASDKSDYVNLGDLVEGPDGVLRPAEGPRIDASPERARVPAAPPRSPSVAPSAALVAPVVDSGAADWARELAALVEPVKVEPVIPTPQDLVTQAEQAAQERLRIARARVALVRLFDAIRSPHLARYSLPYAPEILIRAGVCDGCGQRVAADRVEGHAVSAATKPSPKLRCVRWSFGIPEDQA